MFHFIPNDFTLLFSLYFIEGVYYDPTGTIRFQAGFNWTHKPEVTNVFFYSLWIACVQNHHTFIFHVLPTTPH
jgi:hypothetical protein